MGIIKSFSEFIGESFWGDVHKRSRGDVMRREDAVTYKDLQKEDATIEDLYRYLTQHYTPIAKMDVEVYPINDIQFYEDPDEQGKDCIVIPVTISGEYIEVEPDSFSPGDIYAIDIPWKFVNFAKKVGFDIEKDKERGRYRAIYNSGMPVKKYQVVDLLDKLLAYVDNPILKKKSSLMESFWGDVHRRSRGDEIRREDIIHYEDLKNEKCTLDILYQYLLQHYTVLGDDKITFDENKGIEIPVKLENEPITVIPTDHNTVFSIEAPFSLREYIEKSKYVSDSWDEEQCIEVIISEESDDMCCSDAVNFLDELLSLIPTPALKKSEQLVKESFWGDVHKRSRGDEVRKEDENKCTEYAKKYAPVVMKAIQDAGLGKKLYSNEFRSIMFFDSQFAQYVNDTEFIDGADYDDSEVAGVGIKKDFTYDDYFCTNGDLFVGCITPSDGSSDINLWIEFSYGDEDAEDDMEPAYIFYSVADDEWNSTDLHVPDRNNCDNFMKKLLSTITMAINPKTKYTPKWFGI